MSVLRTKITEPIDTQKSRYSNVPLVDFYRQIFGKRVSLEIKCANLIFAGYEIARNLSHVVPVQCIIF